MLNSKLENFGYLMLLPHAKSIFSYPTSNNATIPITNK